MSVDVSNPELTSFQPKTESGTSPEINADSRFPDYLRDLSTFASFTMELDKIKGNNRDFGDVMKEVIGDVRNKLEAAKAAQQAKSSS